MKINALSLMPVRRKLIGVALAPLLTAGCSVALTSLSLGQSSDPGTARTRLSNISTRAYTGAGQNALIGGFIVRGVATKG